MVEFTDGVTYNTVSEELCYLGSQATATPVDLVENFDCESYVQTAPRTDDFPYLVIDTMETKTWNLGTSVTGGLSCPEQLVSLCFLVAYVECVLNVQAFVRGYSSLVWRPWSALFHWLLYVPSSTLFRYVFSDNEARRLKQLPTRFLL